MVAKLLAILLLLCRFCFAQSPEKVLQFTQKFKLATNDSDKVVALGELAEYYYVYRLSSKADSVLQKQLNLAELSHNKNLVFATLFGKAVSNINPWSSIETFEKTSSFIQQGLNYAVEEGREDYVALAHISMANLLRKRGQYNNALQHATLAFSSIGNLKLDSIKAILYLELGDIYKEKKNAFNAYKNYTNALSLAENLDNIPLQSEVYHHLAELYESLKYKDLAKANLLTSLQLNKTNNNRIGIANDYIDLARFTNEKDYFDKSLALSLELKSDRHILYSKKLMLAYYMVILKSNRLAIDYLLKNKDIAQYYKNQGIASYYFTLGNIYKYSGKPDSALFYYNLAEPEMNKSFDVTTRRLVYMEMGDCYSSLNINDKAVNYLESALELSRGIGEYGTISDLTQQLSKVYAKLGDYKKAYEYNDAYLQYQDSIKQLTNDRNLVLLEVKRDEEKKARELQISEAKALRKKNMQYMAITIAISTIFLGMILLGMFPISKVTIKILGFFAFICLFEFIVLLIDSYLHQLTHGEPLKIWLIKIFLIALLVPLQHFLEHSVVKFLESQKLLHLRRTASFKKWWKRKTNSASKTTGAEFETDTAVL